MPNIDSLYKYFVNLNFLLIALLYIAYAVLYFVLMLGIVLNSDQKFSDLVDFSLTYAVILFVFNIVLLVVQSLSKRSISSRYFIQGLAVILINPGILWLLYQLMLITSNF